MDPSEPPPPKSFYQKKCSMPKMCKIFKNWKFFSILIIPLSLMWICFIGYFNKFFKDKVYRAIFTLTVAGSYWMFDCMPLAATAFLPLIMFPLLKIKDGKVVMSTYMQDVGMMTFACSLLALGIISSGLSKKLAIKIISLVGTDFRKIMFMLMIFAALFSMWFVNTAVMILMMNVAEELLTELRDGVNIGTLGDKKMVEWQDALDTNPQDIVAFEDLEDRNMVQQVENLGPKSKTPEPSVLEKPKEKENAPLDQDIPEKEATGSDEKIKALGSTASLGKKALGSTTSLGPVVEKKESQESKGSYAEQILDKGKTEEDQDENAESPPQNIMDKIKAENEEMLETYKISLFHAIAVSANIGGLFWPYSATSSLGIFSNFLGNKGRSWQPINLVVWMNFTFPVGIICFLIACFYLNLVNFGVGCRKPCGSKKPGILEITKTTDETREKILLLYREKYEEMKKLNSHERGIISVITILVLLLVWKGPGSIEGWASIFSEVYIKDSTIAVLAAVVAFIVPKCGLDMFRGPKNPTDKASFTALIGWKVVQATFPWGLLIFIGGGTSLAAGFLESGFSTELYDGVNKMHNFQNLSSKNWVAPFALLISMLITGAVAHFITNTAASIVAVAVLSRMTHALRLAPGSLTIPCLTLCSLAIALPAGTPTMALAHMKTGRLNGCYCSRKGGPIFLMCFIVVYVFGLFYIESLINIRNYTDPTLTKLF